jgi:hypothetical protein
MNRRPLHFITREKEWELLQKLLTIVDSSQFDPTDTVVAMVSPDYSATVAMHLAHAWSRNGEIIPISTIDVPYPKENNLNYELELLAKKIEYTRYKKIVCVEAGIIRGSNWNWILNVLIEDFSFEREDITLVAMCENIHSKVKSDYVGEYYDDEKEELMFYFERYNKNWEVR